jgi:uncharacterized protein DUF6496
VAPSPCIVPLNQDIPEIRIFRSPFQALFLLTHGEPALTLKKREDFRKGETNMEEDVKKRAKRDAREGKAPSTQAGEFVHEEIEHIRQGKHGARSTKQAIAIGLSKARRAGVKLKPPKKGATSERTRKSASRAYHAGQSGKNPKVSPRRSRATSNALKREGHSAASSRALSRQAKRSAAKRKK